MGNMKEKKKRLFVTTTLCVECVERGKRGMRECVEGVKGGAECDIERVVG